MGESYITRCQIDETLSVEGRLEVSSEAAARVVESEQLFRINLGLHHSLGCLSTVSFESLMRWGSFWLGFFLIRRSLAIDRDSHQLFHYPDLWCWRISCFAIRFGWLTVPGQVRNCDSIRAFY